MRRTPVLLAALAIAASAGLVGCSGSSSSASSASATASASASVAADECAPENLTTRSGGTLTIAVPKVVAPPYYVTDDPTKPDGDPASGQGYEAAVIAELAKRLGLGSSQVTWLTYPKDYETSLDSVDAAAGRIVISARDNVEFTTPIASSGASVVASDSGALASATTKDQVIAQRPGVVGDTATIALLTELGVPTDRLSIFRSLDSAIAALKGGRISGLVLDDASAAYVAANVTGTKVIGTWGSAKADLGLALRAGDPLLHCLDATLAAMSADGTLTSLASQWLQPVDAPVLATGSSH